ncbi:hypothetical protein ACTWQB_16550 [Piscibacillus sp. B03]|uniref:hypothetical protein n=1 Tax=Piscibacillus sp. B03 TaxID=3457430 RepID=UPI003FCE9C14
MNIHLFEKDDLYFTAELYETSNKGLRYVDGVEDVNRDVAESFMLAIIEGYRLDRNTKVFVYIIQDGLVKDAQQKTVGDYLDCVEDVPNNWKEYWRV